MTKNDLKNADKYLVKFSKLIRMVLENSMHKLIPLEDDLKATEIYIQLEQIRSGNKFDYKITTDAGIDLTATLVPPMLLQPFIENSIWHGLNNLDEKGLIEITINKQNDMLHCIISDNGKGLKNQAHEEYLNEKKKSLGMSITKQRIELLNEKGENKTSIIVKNREENNDNSHGVLVEIMLPLVTE